MYICILRRTYEQSMYMCMYTYACMYDTRAFRRQEARCIFVYMYIYIDVYVYRCIDV